MKETRSVEVDFRFDLNPSQQAWGGKWLARGTLNRVLLISVSSHGIASRCTGKCATTTSRRSRMHRCMSHNFSSIFFTNFQTSRSGVGEL